MSVRRTGLKRHRVDIQRYTLTQDAQGGQTRTLASVDGLWWAEIQPTTGLEREQGDQQKAIRTHRLYMRFFDPGVEEDDKVIYIDDKSSKTRTFNIVAVIDSGERGRDTVLDVKEAVVVA